VLGAAPSGCGLLAGEDVGEGDESGSGHESSGRVGRDDEARLCAPALVVVDLRPLHRAPGGCPGRCHPIRLGRALLVVLATQRGTRATGRVLCLAVAFYTASRPTSGASGIGPALVVAARHAVRRPAAATAPVRPSKPLDPLPGRSG
jgi:hypothetical protein